MNRTKEKKKKPRELKIKIIKQLNSIMRMRANEQAGLDKVDPNKVCCYKMIENVTYGEVDAFKKRSNRSYAIKDIDFYDTKEYKSMKIVYHVVLGKNGEDVCSLVKIVKLIWTTPDVMFEGVLQKYRYHVFIANNVLFNFAIVDFP